MRHTAKAGGIKLDTGRGIVSRSASLKGSGSDRAICRRGVSRVFGGYSGGYAIRVSARNIFRFHGAGADPDAGGRDPDFSGI